ncbi:MAG: M48 family metallopeptidase [Pseudomonadota bacterium]
MRFEPRQPDASVNVSSTHPLTEASTLLVGLSVLVAALMLVAYFSIELLIRVVPAGTEANWFAGLSPVESRAPTSDAERAAADLLAELAAQWPDAPYAFRLEVLDDPTPNALALPGGLVVISQGLLDAVESENALAFVLAHEIGHFHHRDHIRQLGRAAAVGLFATALGAADGSTVGLTMTDLTMRGFGRAQEANADGFALGVVNEHYGHVAGSWSFFERLIETEGDRRFAAYLSTHPASAQRIVALQEQALGQNWRIDGPLSAWPPATR